MRGLRGAHVRAHRNVHANVAGESRGDRADREAPCQHPIRCDSQHDEQQHADDRDGRVLAVQVGLGAGLDCSRNFLHACVAGIDSQNRRIYSTP